MNAPTGYSGRPLADKLGLKDGQAVAFSALPKSLEALLVAKAFKSVETVEEWSNLRGADLDVVHVFTDRAADIEDGLPALRERLRPDGMIWVSWPKRASRVPTDLTEDVIRDRALRDILVDVKVCAMDEVWSGLKLVVRKEYRR